MLGVKEGVQLVKREYWRVTGTDEVLESVKGIGGEKRRDREGGEKWLNDVWKASEVE